MVRERTVRADSRTPPTVVRAGRRIQPPAVVRAGCRTWPAVVSAGRRTPGGRRPRRLHGVLDLPDSPSRNGSCVTGSWGRSCVDPREETS